MTKKKSIEDKLLKKMGVSEDDMNDLGSGAPDNAGTIAKNTYLVNHVKDNCRVPDEFKDEAIDTIMGMTERKLLDSSNLFNFIVSEDVVNDVDKMLDSIHALHGIMLDIMYTFNDELQDHLSNNAKGILNVLHFGRTTDVLQSKEEILGSMKEFNNMSDEEKAKSELGKALLPHIMHKIKKGLRDIQEQCISTGIYSTSKDEKVIKSAIASGQLQRLFLGTKDGTGAYAIRVSKGGKPQTKEQALLDMVKDLDDMSDDDFEKLVKEVIDNKSKEKN